MNVWERGAPALINQGRAVLVVNCERFETSCWNRTFSRVTLNTGKMWLTEYKGHAHVKQITSHWKHHIQHRSAYIRVVDVISVTHRGTYSWETTKSVVLESKTWALCCIWTGAYITLEWVQWALEISWDLAGYDHSAWMGVFFTAQEHLFLSCKHCPLPLLPLAQFNIRALLSYDFASLLQS